MSLSDKIVMEDSLMIKDVKEFIRELKENFKKWGSLGYLTKRVLLDHFDLIDELAGDKLI